MKKKLLICAVLCGGAFVAAKNVDLIQEKLFNGKDQDEFLKILDVARVAGDFLMWPAHYVTALLP